MRKYRILKNYVEIRVKNQHEIVEGCSISCEEPELIAVFDTLAEAEVELKKYSTSVHYTPHTVSYYAVTEYCIEICEYDEDGEFESGSDYIFTEMPDLDGVLI